MQEHPSRPGRPAPPSDLRFPWLCPQATTIRSPSDDELDDAHEGEAGTGPIFHDIDIARVRLIHDMRVGMRIEDETIPMILSLLDQVYDLRAGLRAVLRAVDAQPAPVREAILAAIN